jgi:DNA-binding response OmpR family regulator
MRVTVPTQYLARDGQAPMTDESGEQAPVNRPAHIVVAEDDDVVRELIVTHLELAGYTTSTARNGYQALEVMTATQPQGVVLDLGMPKMDGMAVLKALRANARLRDIPVLVLTARHTVDDAQMAMALGAKDYMTKPFDGGRLIERIGRLIQASSTTPP